MRNPTNTTLENAARSEARHGMKVVVLGATGGTGMEIVRRAMEHGHRVTAMARSPQRLKAFEDRIIVKQGDLLDRGQLQRVIEGHDAVVSGFGPRAPGSKADANLLERFAVALTGAMHEAGVRRAVVESVAFLFRGTVIPPTYLVGRLFFPAIVADASAMERVFRESELDWTIVRPPRLTDRLYTGKYREREDRLPRFGFTISRANVADWMVRSLDNHRSVGKVVGLAN